MKISVLRPFLVGVFCALTLAGRAQIVQFNASLTAAQETPATTSAATGSAIVLYNVAANTVDLIVTLSNFPNAITEVRLQEGAAGASGPAIVRYAPALFARAGNSVTATILGQAYTSPGTPLTLLQNGAYLNVVTAQFPNGEIRGQLIAQPKKLVANFTVAQEQAAFPAVNLTAANLADFGGAVMYYNPGTNRVSLRLSVYNFKNVLNNSHYHEGAPGVSGPVVVNLGNNANAGGYTTANGYIDGSFDIPYTGGDPIKLLTGGAYLNFHSTTFTGGECRGQVRTSEEIPSSRVINLSTRGNVGTGPSVLIGGFSVLGPDPIRVLISAKGPSLSAYGVTGALADPFLQLFDSAGRQIAFNDNVGTVAATSELAAIPGAPTNASESALLLVLPPGNYTAQVSGVGGTTGIALLEATDLRILGPASGTATQVIASLPKNPTPAQRRAALQRTLELCSGLPLAVAAVKP
jgi:hypothetical protein